MTGGGPLGRDSLPFAETMKRLHGEIERLVYAAETNCTWNPPPLEENISRCKDRCSFYTINHGCLLSGLRMILGDHIEQHDAMPAVPPCQCAGRCNK